MIDRIRNAFDRDTRPHPATRVSALAGFLRILVCALAFAQIHAAFAADQDMIGLTRADVLTSLGKPQSTLRRGDTELLVYPNGVRVELRDDAVVSFRGSEQAVVVASDGTRYLAGSDGKVHRADPPPPEAPTDETIVSTPASVPAPAAQAAATVPESSSAAKLKTDMKRAVAASGVAAEDDSPVPVDDSHAGKMRAEMEKSVENLANPAAPPPPQPMWVRVVSGIISVALHFVIVVVVLRIALQIVGVPFFWPDLIKVCLLYLAVREGLRGISDLGGAFEFIALFRIDEAVSLIALSIFLFRFKIALSGLTALKVAFATKSATYMLMMGVGLALSFGMMGMK